MLNQKTLARRVTFKGLGVHTGIFSEIVLWPAPVNTGIVFYNTNSAHKCSIKIGSVIPDSAMHATVITCNHKKWSISTIEHLMAALGMLEISNVIIETNTNEIPILDGSSFIFIQEIIDAGITQQFAQHKKISPLSPRVFSDNDGRSITIEPIQNNQQLLKIDYITEFNHPFIPSSHFSHIISQNFFTQTIAPARTFGLLEQLPYLREQQLVKGASLGNSLVISKNGILNHQRFFDECIRHKVLDLIGDLMLLGAPLVGHVKAKKTSHNFNRLVIQDYLNHPQCWTYF